MKRRLLILTAIVAWSSGSWAAASGRDARMDLRRTPTVKAIERVRGSVVNISTERVVVVRRGVSPFFGDDVFDRMFEDFFGRGRGAGRVERKRVQTPLGSGCVITSDGLVVTNEHVIRRASNIKLSLPSGETFDAELLAADPTEDLALLRAKAKHALKAIPMGTSRDMMLGEAVLALGNPFGFENSVTTGIVSAFNREIEVGGREGIKYTGLVQTSALINPGNSGGPLVNILGELIGINTAVVDQAQGIGFSIPIDRARDVLAPLMATPQVSEAWPGFAAVTTEKRDGIVVKDVEPGAPAAQVLRTGDVIREVEGKRVCDLFDFLLRVVQHKPGDTVALAVTRKGKALPLRLMLGKMEVPSPAKMLRLKLGVQGQDLTPALARQLRTGVSSGFLISEVVPDSPAANVGLQPRDVLIQVGPHPVKGLREAASALRNTRPGQRVFVRLIRGNYSARTWITVK